MSTRAAEKDPLVLAAIEVVDARENLVLAREMVQQALLRRDRAFAALRVARGHGGAREGSGPKNGTVARVRAIVTTMSGDIRAADVVSRLGDGVSITRAFEALHNLSVTKKPLIARVSYGVYRRVDTVETP